MTEQSINIHIEINPYLTGNTVSLEVGDITVRLTGDTLLSARLPRTITSMMGRIDSEMAALMIERIAQGLLEAMAIRKTMETKEV